jgi:hypothetical protein
MHGQYHQNEKDRQIFHGRFKFHSSSADPTLVSRLPLASASIERSGKTAQKGAGSSTPPPWCHGILQTQDQMRMLPVNPSRTNVAFAGSGVMAEKSSQG